MAWRSPALPTSHVSRAPDLPPEPAMATRRALTIPKSETEVELTIGGRRVRLTNLDKLFWPDDGITKRQLLQYYADVSPWLLPHLRDRAMVMKRYPNGAYGKCFFMKRVPEPHPDWLETCTIDHRSGNVIDFPVVNDLASLLWVVNLGCIDLNQWYARCDDVDRPDYLHFDLDPVKKGGVTFRKVLDAALVVRDALEALGMTPLVKTTGSAGAHLYVPIVRGPTQKQVWTFAKALAQALAAKHPEAAHRRVSHRRTSEGSRAGGLQPERVGTHPRVHLFTAAQAGCVRLHPAHLEGGGARREDRGLSHRQRAGTAAEARRSLEAAAREARPLRSGDGAMTLPIPRTYAPMEAKLVDELPIGGDWQYEPKWDGFRCLAFRDGDKIDLMSKAGKPLARYFPELVETLRAVKAPRFVLDGEIVIPHDGTLSFDELLLRIHPAKSRIAKLSVESPASLIVFDLLVDAKGTSLVKQSLVERREALEKFVSAKVPKGLAIHLSPATTQHGHGEEVVSLRRGWARRHHRQATGSRLPRRHPRRDAEDEAHAHRRVRRRWLSLRVQGKGRRFAPARPVRRRWTAASRRLHLEHSQRREARRHEEAREVEARPRIHRAGARWSEPLEYRTLEPMGAARPRSSSSRCSTTTSPVDASATAPPSFAGVPTSLPPAAPSTQVEQEGRSAIKLLPK